MSDIGPISGPPRPNVDRPGGVHRQPSAVPQGPSHEDSVELSPLSRMRGLLKQLPDVRQDLVDRVRSEIAAGTYETPEKIDGLLDELVDDLRLIEA